MSNVRDSMSRNFGSSSDYKDSVSFDSPDYKGSVSTSFGSSDYKGSVSTSFSTQSCSPRPRLPRSFSTDTQEKNELILLNNQFVKLIDEVKTWEDAVIISTEKLKILEEYEVYKGQVNDIEERTKMDMEYVIMNLKGYHEKLKDEKEEYLKDTENTKKRVEEEKEKKKMLEDKFSAEKKDLDEVLLVKLKLMLCREDLEDRFDFLKAGFAEEIKELKSQIQNKHVILRRENVDSLDSDITQHVNLLYSNMVHQLMVEAERWQRERMDPMVMEIKQQEKGLEEVNKTIIELKHQINHLQEDLKSLTSEEESLTKEIVNAQEETEMDKEEITLLNKMLTQEKHELDILIQEIQNLLNVKQDLGFEIAAYRNVLETEEQRIGYRYQRTCNQVHVQHHTKIKTLLPPEPERPTPGRTIVSLPGGQGVSTNHQMVIQIGVTQESHRVEASYHTD